MFHVNPRAIVQTVFCLAFCVGLVLPGTGMLLPIAPKIQITENRKLAGMPSLPKDGRGISAFLTDFENYYKDNFGFRLSLIRAHSLYKAKLLADSPHPKVIIGKEKWLFFSGESEELLKYEKPLSEQDLQGMLEALKARKRMFSRNGCLFFALIAPNKQSLYAEYLPEPQAQWQRDRRFYDQLYDYVAAHSDLDLLIDVKSELLREKNRGRLVYFKTDSHWNPYASWLAYQCIMRKLCKYKPELRGKVWNDTAWSSMSYSGDLVKMFACEKLFEETNEFLAPCNSGRWAHFKKFFHGQYRGEIIKYPVVVTESAKGIPLKVIVLHDSQFEALIPCFSENFRKVIYFTHLENMNTINKIIGEENPDIIIQEVVERALRHKQYVFRTDDPPFERIAGPANRIASQQNASPEARSDKTR